MLFNDGWLRTSHGRMNHEEHEGHEGKRLQRDFPISSSTSLNVGCPNSHYLRLSVFLSCTSFNPGYPDSDKIQFLKI